MLQIAIVVREILFTMFGLTVSIFFSRKYAQIIWINTTNVVYKQYRNVDNFYCYSNIYIIVEVKFSSQFKVGTWKKYVDYDLCRIPILYVFQGDSICYIGNIFYINIYVLGPSVLCFQKVLIWAVAFVEFHSFLLAIFPS